MNYVFDNIIITNKINNITTMTNLTEFPNLSAIVNFTKID